MTLSAETLLLEPDPRAAQQARALLAKTLGKDGELAEVAKLLVSELVTNAVVHAASSVELEVQADDDGVTVRVRDADTGPLEQRSRISELDEGGRGLLLIAQLADAWGTEHSAGRKTVWFRLGGQPVAPPPVPISPPRSEVRGPARIAERRLRTLILRPVLQRALSFEQQLGELLARIMDAIGARGATAVGPTGAELCTRGQVSELTAHTCALVFDDRELGRLTVFTQHDLDDEDEAFLHVAAERVALLASEHGVLHAEQERAANLDYLSEATELLASSLSVSLSLILVAQIVVPRIGEWCAIYTVDERAEARRLTSNHRVEEQADELNQMLDKDRDVALAVSAAAAGGPAQHLPATVPIGGRRNAVAVMPLTSRGRTLGVVVLGRYEPLDAVGFMALLELGRRAALAVDNARLREEQVAAAEALQASLLPSALPVIDGVELAARYHSASPSLSVGGDFYDAFLLPDGSFVCAIGDVCGKGAEAAAVTGMTRDLLRLLLQDGHGLAGSLRRLNRALLENAGSSRFCTVALARVVPNGKTMRVEICLAGHPEPALLRADGSTDLAGVTGDLLGVLPDDIDLHEVVVEMAPGDALVLYTDGVTERRDGLRMFGQDGLLRALEHAQGMDAERLADQVETAAQSFVNVALRDDLAILVLRRPPK